MRPNGSEDRVDTTKDTTEGIRVSELDNRGTLVESSGEFDVRDLEPLRRTLEGVSNSGLPTYVDLSGVTFWTCDAPGNWRSGSVSTAGYTPIGSARGPSMFWRQTHGKDEVSEMLMFSGLETQSEISLLLDELYGGLSGRASLERVGGEHPVYGGALSIPRKSEDKHERGVTGRSALMSNKQLRTKTL